jgi:uncharacterized protein (DUF488 family)
LAVRKAYTIGFTKRRAPDFFGAIKDAGIKRLIDVRLNNSSQLAGFTKREDLPYFLEKICRAEYIHEPLLAPTQELLDAYKKHHGSWQTYKKAFLSLMLERRVEERLSPALFDVPTVLLCSEHTADRCHRRLVLEYLRDQWGNLEIIHL